MSREWSHEAVNSSRTAFSGARWNGSWLCLQTLEKTVVVVTLLSQRGIQSCKSAARKAQRIRSWKEMRRQPRAMRCCLQGNRSSPSVRLLLGWRLAVVPSNAGTKFLYQTQKRNFQSVTSKTRSSWRSSSASQTSGASAYALDSGDVIRTWRPPGAPIPVSPDEDPSLGSDMIQFLWDQRASSGLQGASFAPRLHWQACLCVCLFFHSDR